MARNPIQTQKVASGIDSTSDPVTMPLNRARGMVNLQVDRLGVLRNRLRLVNQLPSAITTSVEGVSWYSRATIQNNTAGAPYDILTDLLVMAAGGFLFIAQPSSDPLLLPVRNLSVVFGGATGYVASAAFFTGKRVRFAALQSELLMVQEGGLLLLRFYASPTLGSGFYRAGIEPPLSSGTYSNLTLAATGTGLTGTWQYKLTFADEQGRESSPTPALSIALVNQGAAATLSTVYGPVPDAYGGSNLVTANLYRNTQGAPDTFYRIATTTVPTTTTTKVFPANSFFYNSNAYDNAPDASIVGGELCPNPGENDPPNPASIICIWKNRVLMNDTTDSTTLQISNTLSPTQWTAIATTPVTVTDGERSSVGTDQGDPMTAIVEFGSFAAVFKRRACFFLSGNDISDFLIQPIHTRGCIAPDSCVRCDNVVLFLSDDGVYAASYGGGEGVSKVSKEIEADLLAIAQETREASLAWFVDNSYHLQVGTVTFVYNFDVLGWTTYQFGSGFENDQQDSGLIGGEVPFEPPVITACSVTLSENALTFDNAGGSEDITVTAYNSSAIGYVVSDPWISIVGPSMGSGTATVTVAANSGSDRTGFVGICDSVVTIAQAANEAPEIVLSMAVCP